MTIYEVRLTPGSGWGDPLGLFTSRKDAEQFVADRLETHAYSIHEWRVDFWGPVLGKKRYWVRMLKDGRIVDTRAYHDYLTLVKDFTPWVEKDYDGGYSNVENAELKVMNVWAADVSEAIRIAREAVATQPITDKVSN